MLGGTAEVLNLFDTHLWTNRVMDILVEKSEVMSSTIQHQSEPKENKTQPKIKMKKTQQKYISCNKSVGADISVLKQSKQGKQTFRLFRRQRQK